MNSPIVLRHGSHLPSLLLAACFSLAVSGEMSCPAQAAETSAKAEKAAKPAAAATAATAAPAAEEPATAAASKKATPLAEIGGVRVGQTIAEACAKLDPVSERLSRITRDRGDRYVWKLKDENSPFAHISARTNREGKISSLTGFLRASKELPFADIADLKAAGSVEDGRAFWDVRDAAGKVTYRITAKGAQRKAAVVALVAAPKRNRTEQEKIMSPEQLSASIDETDKAPR